MNTLKLALACSLVGIATVSLAHNEATHPTEVPIQVQKEQKPWGIAGEAKATTRTIAIRMDDAMRFTPGHIEVKEGETVRLRVRNDGKVMHELVLGTRQELEAHAAMMQKHPGMEHDEPYMAHVAPGKNGEIVWTFNRAGEFEFACLIVGHFQAGMKGTIRVVSVTPSKATIADPTVNHQVTANDDLSVAEVRRVDKSSGKITLKHQHIKNLDMAPMTMVFQVRDAVLLDKVQPGDAVRFTANKINGAYILTSIELQPK